MKKSTKRLLTFRFDYLFRVIVDTTYLFILPFQIMKKQNLSALIVAVMALTTVVSCAKKEEDSKKKETVGTVIGIDLGTTYSW